MILAIAFISLFLLIWFRTEAFVEYCRLFRLDAISHYKDYYEKRKNDVSLDYHGYLRQYQNSFKNRLITCPICVSVWLSLFISPLCGSFCCFPIVCLLSLIVFGIVSRLLN